MANDQGPCRLESLWPELRSQIIWELMDFSALRALVHASPVFHADYREQRCRLLDSYELGYLDPRLRTDAILAVRSPKFYDDEGRPRYHSQRHDYEGERTIDFLKEYGRAHDDRASEQNEWMLSRRADEKTDLRRLHQVMKVIVNDYCAWIAYKMPPEASPLKLSDLERTRLLRAMYRYQTYCSLFSHNPILKWFESGVRHPLPYLLHPLSPWEVMEVACVEYYLSRRWLGVIQKQAGTGHFTKTMPAVFENIETKSSAFDLMDGSWDAYDPEGHLTEDDRGIFTRDDDDTIEYQTYRITEFCQHLAGKGLDYFATFLAIESPKERYKLVDTVVERFPASVTTSNRAISQYPYLDGYPLRERWNPKTDCYERIPPIFPDDSVETKNFYETNGFAQSGSKYQRVAILDQLQEMPESDQPSAGWKWFCEMYNIDEFAVGHDLYYQWKNVRGRCKKREMRWGFPFWDKEIVERLAPDSPAPESPSPKDSGEEVVDDGEGEGGKKMDLPNSLLDSVIPIPAEKFAQLSVSGGEGGKGLERGKLGPA